MIEPKIMGSTESDPWQDALRRAEDEFQREFCRDVADFLIDQIRHYPEAERALRHLSVRIRGGDL